MSALPLSVSGVPPRAAAVITATYATHGSREQARLLGISHQTALTYRSLLVRAGVLDPARRAEYRRYSPEEQERAAQLARAGCTLREIAESLGRPACRVSRLLAPLGGIRALRAAGGGDAWLSAGRCAALMGVHRGTVVAWVEVGALVADRTNEVMTAHGKPRRVRRGNVRGSWRVSRAALCDFVRDRAWWMTYGVSAIQDADIRQLALTARSTAGGRWEKLRAVAQQVAAPRRLSDATLARWRALGWPRGAEGWEVLRRGTTDWLWVPEGSALPAPPRPRPRRSTRRPTAYPKRKVCTACGGTFLVTRQDRWRVTCGPACRKARHARHH